MGLNKEKDMRMYTLHFNNCGNSSKVDKSLKLIRRWSGLKFARNMSLLAIICYMVGGMYINAILFGVIFTITAVGYEIIRGGER